MRGLERRIENHKLEYYILKGQVSPGLGRLVSNPRGQAFLSNPGVGDAFGCQEVLDSGPQPQ